ncbi:MAG: DUF2520 domain-containing protein [Curvibacter sp.]|nr:MAG: DUF2520 domain-containing protein [Curvibacter sp.]
MKTISLLGAGRVGRTLATLWRQHGVFQIQDVQTSRMASAQDACNAIGAGTAVARPETMRPADVWMIAVPDIHIAEVAAKLAQARPESPTPPIVFHCSGALNASALQPLASLGWRTASAHCILSFANVEAAVQQFAGTACALEGDMMACNALDLAFGAIGAQCFRVAGEDKILYHAGAVFATNFLPVIQSVAEAAWARSGVPEGLLPQLRANLLRNAVDNITLLGPAGALTGPAARGDTAAIARQAAVVEAWDSLSGDAYRSLSALALRLARGGG